MSRWVMLAVAAVALASCATSYQQESFTGGFDVLELRPDVYRVSFQGNGYTTRESVQVYWLYRCAELAVEKGFAGFEILSDLHFVTRRPSIDERIGPALSSAVVSLWTRIPVSPDKVADVALWRNPSDLATQSAEPIRVARGGVPIFIFDRGSSARKPVIEGDVHFLATPVESRPPKVFNAAVLRAQLEPIVQGKKCGVGNVCPHVHDYLLPKGKLW
jgi:hypothetical protein